MSVTASRPSRPARRYRARMSTQDNVRQAVRLLIDHTDFRGDIGPRDQALSLVLTDQEREEENTRRQEAGLPELAEPPVEPEPEPEPDEISDPDLSRETEDEQAPRSF